MRYNPYWYWDISLSRIYAGIWLIPYILASIFSDLIEWDKTALKKIANLTIPVLCIITDEHHCAFSKLQSCNNKIEIGKVVCSRCWATLEVPEQVNSMILRFLEIQGFNQN